MDYVKLLSWIAIGFIFVIAVCSMTSCHQENKVRPVSKPGVELITIVDNFNIRVYRVQTDEAVCYIYSGGNKGGLQCKWKNR